MATNAPGCQPKGLWAIPAGAAGATLATGAYAYAVVAVVGSTPSTACGFQAVQVNNAGSPPTNSAVIQWNATPSAAAYKIYRAPLGAAGPTGPFQALVFPVTGGGTTTALPPGAVCPPGGTGAGPRCFTQDRGFATDPADATVNFPAALTNGGSHPDLRIVQCVDYGNTDDTTCPITNPATDDPTTDDPANASPPAIRSDVLQFAPGLLANPTAAPACKLSGPAPSLLGDPAKHGSQDPDEDTCSPASLVGTAQTISRIHTKSGVTTITLTPGDIYIGQAQGGFAAVLYVVLRPACSAGSPVSPTPPRNPTCNAITGSATGEVQKEFLAARARFVTRDGGAIDVETVKAEDNGELPPTLNVLDGVPFQPSPDITVQVRQLRQDLFGVATQGTADGADDRPFTALPTSCGEKSLGAVVRTYDDTTAKSAVGKFTVTACDALPFAPKIAARVGGDGRTGANASPDLDVTITQAVGEAATKSAKVTLPDSLQANLAAIAGACTEAQVSAGSCTAIGSASATTPVLPGTLSGPVYIVQSSSGLPKLVVSLAGTIELRLEGTIDISGGTRLVNLFDNIPDVPLASFNLHINGGAGGLLRNARNLCDTGAGSASGEFTAHSGKTATSAADVVVTGTCQYTLPTATRPKVTITISRLKSGRPTITLTVRRGRANRISQIRRVRLTVPKGLAFKKKAAKRGLRMKAGARKVPLKRATIQKRILNVRSVPGTATSKFTATMRKGFVRSSGALKRRGRKARPRLKVRVVTRDGTVFNITRKVKPKS